MKFILCSLLFSLSEAATYSQRDYLLIMERIDVINYDPRYFSLIKINNFKYNRTNFGVNFTLNIEVDFGENLMVQVQSYKFASNEYRLFPIRFMIDLCDNLSKNNFGVQNIYSCGNFTRCPMKKGNYTICNWGPDYSRFPPYTPGGRYMSELIFMYKSNKVAQFQPYMEVKPKNPWEM